MAPEERMQSVEGVSDVDARLGFDTYQKGISDESLDFNGYNAALLRDPTNKGSGGEAGDQTKNLLNKQATEIEAAYAAVSAIIPKFSAQLTTFATELKNAISEAVKPNEEIVKATANLKNLNKEISDMANVSTRRGNGGGSRAIPPVLGPGGGKL
jgi:gas vesicle protein